MNNMRVRVTGCCDETSDVVERYLGFFAAAGTELSIRVNLVVKSSLCVKHFAMKLKGFKNVS